MITEIEIRDNLDWFLDNDFDIGITQFKGVSKVNIFYKNFAQPIKMKEFSKMKIDIYKNLYRFYKLNSDKKITFKFVKLINERDFNFGHNLAKDKFNEIKDYCVRKNIKCNLESKKKLNSSTIILLNIYFDEDKFINEKDFFIKIISTRFFIYIE